MRLSTCLLLLTAACNDATDPDVPDNENEVITTVRLTLTPPDGPAATFTWADPENDGTPVIDAITLTSGTAYDLSVAFLNELETPTEDLTEEVADEADQHQVFFTGAGIAGPASTHADPVATHAYDDTDDLGYPVGLTNTLTTQRAGTAALTVTLRHLPPEGGTPVKTADLAETVAASGFGAIPGDVDAAVSFDLTVQAP